MLVSPGNVGLTSHTMLMAWPVKRCLVLAWQSGVVSLPHNLIPEIGSLAIRLYEASQSDFLNVLFQDVDAE